MIHTLESRTIGDLMFKSLGENKEKGVTTNSVTQRTLRGSIHDVASKKRSMDSKVPKQNKRRHTR